MDIISFAILVIVIIAVVAIVYWFTTKSGIVIPQPLMIVLWAVVAIVCILLVANLAGLGPRVIRV
jgi:hypothetical protein